jgi:tRNA threonylcarbamoyl adenosine modification protein (Sua5/YciO/YrdC/YwlC family)
VILPALDAASWGPSIDAAVHAVERGEAVVFPTDTLYGIGCDAFRPEAVEGILAAKGRGREMPPPVLIPSAGTVDGIARDISDSVRALMKAFWPGPLTIIVNAQPSLSWDLGETGGTVALRVPEHPVALALLLRTGPMAVTSANRTGGPPATSVEGAEWQLGSSVAVYLDGGETPLGEPSTIVDATGDRIRIVREGVLRRAELEAVVGAEVMDGRTGA